MEPVSQIDRNLRTSFATFRSALERCHVESYLPGMREEVKIEFLAAWQRGYVSCPATQGATNFQESQPTEVPYSRQLRSFFRTLGLRLSKVMMF